MGTLFFSTPPKPVHVLSQLGATAKGLPLQFITEQWGNPLWLPHLYGCPNYFMHVPN